MSDLNSYPDPVRNQYEELPYPPRNPNDESKRLIKTGLDNLYKINHYCFAGRESFNNGFRVLVAGGGTGDGVIYLGEQLKNTDAEIVYLDVSLTSMKIAQARAAKRKLENIKWVHGSILKIADFNFKPFNYINCCGVLHHLDNPMQGLSALKSVLKSTGAIGIMVYAKYGRTAIYQIQELMKFVNGSEDNVQTKIDNTRKVLAVIPECNWFNLRKNVKSDHIAYGDAGLYDLFLHSKDRAYSVPELYEVLDHAELKLIDFARDRLLYVPSSIIDNPELLQRINCKTIREQQAIAELLSGIIARHSFYCSMENKSEAIFHETSIPIMVPEEKRQALLGNDPADNCKYEFEQSGGYLSVTVNPIIHTFFSEMDGTSSIADIETKLFEKFALGSSTVKEVRTQLRIALDRLVKMDLVYYSSP